MIPNFRAFNKETKKMYGIDGFKASERKIYRCSFADDEFRSGRLETFHFVEDNLDDYILMQSTGLKDKNGVEIFDGDVVNFMVPNQMISGTYQIRQAKSGEWRLDNRVQGRPLYISGSYHCEVVGNVWEDGDLLESVEE